MVIVTATEGERINNMSTWRHCMKRKTWLKYTIFLLSSLLMGSPAFAGAIYTIDMTSLVSGKIVQKGDLAGWTSTMPEEESRGSMGEAQFIPVDLSHVNTTQGGLRVLLERATADKRSSHIDREAIISFFGEGRPLLTLNVIWDEKWVGPEGTYISTNYLENAKRDGLWPVVIPLGRTVRKGQSLELLFTWGQGKSDNALYVDGRKFNLKYDHKGSYTTGGPRKTLGEQLTGLQKVTLGLEPYDDGNWNPANDTIIWEATLYDDPADALNSYRPVISSITHDAFAVAGYSGKLVEGDTYTVILKADPGGTATFDLVQPASTSGGVTIPERIRIADHAMTEDPENPGTYKGVHTVKYGEDVEDGIFMGHFVNASSVNALPVSAKRLATVDTKVYMDVKTSNDLIPADEESKSGITIIAMDTNGKAVRGHELKLTLSTTDQYTGTVGGGSFEDLVGGSVDVDWGGITHSFGEVNAQYLTGFAAKTTLVSAKDMVTGDVDVAWVRSYIDGTVDIVVTEPRVSALSVAGSMDVSLSREWLTADGKSRSRITAVIEDISGKPISGHSVRFTLLGENGSIRMIQGKTDSRGRAMADYIAGIVMGQVQVEVRDLTSGMVVLVPIELRPDAPAEIALTADPGEVVIGGQSTVTAKVTDANGNPNNNVDVLYDISAGSGSVDSPNVDTDEDGMASVVFTAGDKAGLVTVRGTVMSREPTKEEISAAQGAVFLYGLDEDPGRLDVVEWFVETGDEVVEDQELVTLEDRSDTLYTIVAPRDGIVSTFIAEERDRVEYGDTLGYIIEVAE
jgi:biotin carboxyl carrier protein